MHELSQKKNHNKNNGQVRTHFAVINMNTIKYRMSPWHPIQIRWGALSGLKLNNGLRHGIRGFNGFRTGLEVTLSND